MSNTIEQFKLALSQLNNNNKYQIDLLTCLVQDHEGFAAQIVAILFQSVMTATPQKKLLIMYVSDSILKNIKEVYIDLFACNIIPMFLNAFGSSDEPNRQVLYRLRLTWSISKVFCSFTLYNLDTEANKVDPAWPVIYPETGAVLGNDPNVRSLDTSLQRNSKENVSLFTTTTRKRKSRFEEVPPQPSGPPRLVIPTRIGSMMGTIKGNLNKRARKSRFEPVADDNLEPPKYAQKSADPSLIEFKEKNLEVRYDNVISKLLERRKNLCRWCSYDMTKLQAGSSESNEHIDRHVKNSLGIKTPLHTKQWYFTPESWPLSSCAQQESSPQKSAKEEKPLPKEVVSNSNKNCDACHEQFDEYFDDDEDCWMLKNAVAINGMVFHTACSSDI